MHDPLKTVNQFTALIFRWFVKRNFEVSFGMVFEFWRQGSPPAISGQLPNNVDFVAPVGCSCDDCRKSRDGIFPVVRRDAPKNLFANSHDVGCQLGIEPAKKIALISVESRVQRVPSYAQTPTADHRAAQRSRPGKTAFPNRSNLRLTGTVPNQRRTSIGVSVY